MSRRDEKTFGTELRRIRREENKTLENIAEVMKVSIPHVSDIERGRRSPPPRAMIARILESWGRLEDLDTLAELAMKYRGEFQRAPKSANERQVLVALERTLDSGPTEDDFKKLLEFLKTMGGKENG